MKIDKLIATALCFFPLLSHGVDEKSLKQKFKLKQEEQKSAAERLRAGKVNKYNMKLFRDNDLNYVLPNNEVVAGIMLPNGKISPALTTASGAKVPACVSTDYRLFEGRFMSGSIVCKIDQVDLQLVSLDGIQQRNILNETVDGKRIIRDKNGKIIEIIDDTKTEEKNDVVVSKYGEKKPQKKNVKKTKPKPSGKKADPKQSSSVVQSPSQNDIYIPPMPVTASNGNGGSMVVTLKNTDSRFGITKGTWAMAELNETVNSADRGYVEYHLLESLDGRHRTLPSGTVFFASKTFNEQSKRMESKTDSILLPNGQEQKGIAAYVHSIDKTAGLNGTVVLNRGDQTVATGKRIALDLISNAIPSSGSAIQDSIQEGAGELVDQEKDLITNSKGYIKVSPQRVWLRISKSF